MSVDNFFSVLQEDFRRNKGNPKGKIVVTLFRLSHEIAIRKQTHQLLWIICIPWLVFYRVLVEWLLGIEIPARTLIGPGLQIHHGQSLVVNDHTRIGKNVTLRHCTTIGCKVTPDGRQGPSPVIGDNVDIGSNSVIIGPIEVGDGVVIGAGAVVVKSVPPNSIVVGNPANIISFREEDKTI